MHVAPDCYGAMKGHPILKEMLNFYRTHHFKDKNGKLAETWVGIRFSKVIQKLYNIKLKQKILNPVLLPNNGTIYPTFYFEQKKPGKFNYANHFCTHSWSGKNYDNEKYLATCYYNCRTKIDNQTNTIFRNEANSKYIIYVFLLCIINFFFLSIIKKN